MYSYALHDFICDINKFSHFAGALINSNSFRTTNIKPEFMLVDEVFRKQKSMQNPALPYIKEGSRRVMGKSVSSKSFDSDHLRYEDSEAKMLSPNFSHAQDLAGFEHAKEHNFSKRKSSFDFARGSTNLAEKVKGSSISRPGKFSTAGQKVTPVRNVETRKYLLLMCVLQEIRRS